ncbi:MAG: hypothetical protein KAS32_04270 [Candidatus Peribacteraceae bacterium]|nr:hypothetical protein [Candidatus Peribacteraceae bacterium]
MNKIESLIQNFKYPPEAIKDNNLMLTPKTAVKYYEPAIKSLTHTCPRFYKQDAIQELKLCVLQAHKATKGNILPEIMLRQLNDRLKRMVKLERNRGMTYCPDNYDFVELAEKVKESVYNIQNNGNKTKIHNRL